MAKISTRVNSALAMEVRNSNPLLSKGEPFYELDTGGFKVGNGEARYNDLDYAGIVREHYGPQGEKGETGPANVLTIGTVTTGAAGSAASATIGGTSPTQTLSLTIPRGNTGQQGVQGIQGVQGLKGDKGDPGEVTQAQLNAAVAAGVAQVVDSAPGAMDTLNELAAALGDDPNFATTVTNALAGKAPISHTHTAAQISDAGTVGRAVVTAANAAAARSALAAVAAHPGQTPTLWYGSYSDYTALPEATRNGVGFIAVIYQ